MSTSSENTPLRPSIIAAKIAQIRNFEDEALIAEIVKEPRLLEILWFLQYMSMPENNPGGLRKFAADLLADSRDLIGTEAMQQHAGEMIGLEALTAIHEELPMGCAWKCFDGIECLARNVEDWTDFSSFVPGGRSVKAAPKKRVPGPKQLPREALVNACCEEASNDLANYLRALCEQMPYGFRRHTKSGGYSDRRGSKEAPWYFVNVADAIFRFMERRKAALSGMIAQTEISKMVYHWLHKARVTKCAVIIEGNSRFGKTEAVKSFAAMNPGLARYVKTPPSNSEGDLLRAVASALGIQDADKLMPYKLRQRIEPVLLLSGIMLIFDEAQSIFPSTFGRNTPPAKLNYVRFHILDAGLPAAFICTPQSYRSAERKYVKATGYAMEQWSERILKTVHLPEEVSREDLFAIARIHFPGVYDEMLEYVVERAHATQRNYVSDVSKIARLAFSNATDAGASKLTLSHIEAAINDVLPTAPALAAPTLPPPQISPEKRPMHAPCKPRSRAVNPREGLPDPAPTDRHFDRSLEASAEALLPG